MNITLINPRLHSWSPTVSVPLGLTYIASVLECNCHEVQIIDMNADKVSYNELIKKTQYSDIIGITGMITTYHEVINLINLVKRDNNRVVAGGALATTFPEELIKNTDVDWVVKGEGEEAIRSLVSLYENKQEPTLKIICADQIHDLDCIPFPARHLLNMNKYNTQFHDFGKGKINATTMISSRGCPYQCTFCYKDMWGYKWRARSASDIVAEMDSIYNDYKINGFIFNDDTFVLDRKRVIEFCDLLLERDYKWMCNGRVNLVDSELLNKMAESGCVEIAYGIESGNQDMLDLIKKNITIEQIENAVKWTKEAGIRVNGYFMLGLPGETKESIQKTIEFAEKLNLDFYGFSLVTPMPNTELYEYAVDNGYVNKEDFLNLKDWSFNANVNMTKDCTDADLKLFKNILFNKFTLKKFGKWYMLNPRFFMKAIKVIFSLQSFSEFKKLMNIASGMIRGILNAK